MRGRGNAVGELNGFLDAASSVEGELRFESTFRVEGRLKGKVVSGGDLIVGQNAVVEGEIEVGRLYLSGTLRGSARAQRIEIAASARVEADLETPRLVVEEGAHLQGHCSMEDRSAAETIPHPGASNH